MDINFWSYKDNKTVLIMKNSLNFKFLFAIVWAFNVRDFQYGVLGPWAYCFSKFVLYVYDGCFFGSWNHKKLRQIKGNFYYFSDCFAVIIVARSFLARMILIFTLLKGS